MNHPLKFDHLTYFQVGENRTGYSKHISELEITATTWPGVHKSTACACHQAWNMSTDHMSSE